MWQRRVSEGTRTGGVAHRRHAEHATILAGELRHALIAHVIGCRAGRDGAARDMPDLNKVFAGMIALGRVGVPEDIGPMIASLLGEDIRWITAERIEVSGGQVI